MKIHKMGNIRFFEMDIRIVLSMVVMTSVAGCLPFEKNSNVDGKTGAETVVGSGIPVESEAPQLQQNFKKEVLKYASDLEKCEAKYSNMQAGGHDYDLDAIRRALADNPGGTTLVVRHEPGSASAIKVAGVKNCLGEMGYVVSK